MRFSWRLRTRFLLATSVLAMVLCAVFAFAVYQFIELLEDEMIKRTLVREMQQFKLNVESQPLLTPPSKGEFTAFIARSPAERSALPREVSGLSVGMHEDISYRGRKYSVAV